VRILLAGAGRLGRQATSVLAAVSNDVTVIEADDQRAEAMRAEFSDRGVRVVFGDACDPQVLEEAGCLRADAVVAVTGDDEDNLVISLLAKRQFQVARVVARVNDPENGWLFDRAWGVDAAVSAPLTLMSLIEEATRAADTVGLMRLSAAGVVLIETTLTESSAATGKAVSQIPLPPGSQLAAVIRGGQPRVPDGSFKLAAGDEILIVSESATETDVRALFQSDNPSHPAP
jgi:trk system potassium uptake protein TrkA